VTKFRIVSPLFIPSPIQVWHRFIEIAFYKGYKGHLLWTHIGISLLRIFLAFFFAALTAIPLGLLSGLNSTIRAIFTPIIYFYRPLPPLAYYTILIIWLGIGELSKVTLLYLAGFAPIFIASVSAVENVDSNRIIVAKTLGAKKPKLFRHVIIPSCLPEILTGLRTSIGIIYTALVASEMVAAWSGIGWMVLDSSKYLQSDIIFVGIFMMGLTGILIDLTFAFLERKLIPWKGKGS